VAEERREHHGSDQCFLYYAANDTGAAALGLGFGTALGALLFVSLRDRPWMMDT
jgi:hypothetical protein